MIIPAFNRPAATARCVGALRLLTPTPGAFEVLVIDDGSNPPLTLGGLTEGDDGPRVRIIRQDNAGPAAARNAGARAALGRLLAFTDNDCAPDPGWLTALWQAHLENPVALLGGVTVNAARASVPAQASQDLLAFLYADMERRRYDAPFFASNNLAVGSERFAELGGFDTSFPLAAGEDREFGDRFFHAGGTLTLVPDAVVRHHHAMTVGRFWRQHHNYGRGALHFQNARAKFGRPGMKPEGPGFYWGMLSEPFRAPEPGARLRRSALIALSQLATAAGYAAERRVAR